MTWEREADKAAELGLRVVKVRTGVVLDQAAARCRRCCCRSSSAAADRSPAAGSTCRGCTSTTSSASTCARSTIPPGRARSTPPRPEPVTNKTFSKALGKALHRPAVAPIPGAAIRLLYGDMAEIVTKGQRVIPKRTIELGYTFQHADLDEALEAAVG